MKVNFDGACFPKSDEAGIRVVVRNSDSEVMATMVEKIAKPPLVEVLKSLAARRTIVFTMEVGFHRVCLEGDVASVIKVLIEFRYGAFVGWSYFRRYFVFS